MSDDLGHSSIERKKKRLRVRGSSRGKRNAATRPKLRNHRLRRLTGLRNTVPSTQITWTLRQGSRAEHSEVRVERRDNIQEHSFWQVPAVTRDLLREPGYRLASGWAKGAGGTGLACSSGCGNRVAGPKVPVAIDSTGFSNPGLDSSAALNSRRTRST
jgi:hypothetical protein